MWPVNLKTESVMPSYLVLGGGVGKAIAYHLCQHADTDLVTIADKDPSILKIDKIIRKAPHPRCDYIVSDIESLNLISLFKHFDVVISALPAKFNLELQKKAIEAGTNFCDLGGVVDITWQQKKLNQLARKANVSIIPDCGLMPGLGVILAKKLTYDFDLVTTLTIYVGGLPQKPRPPLYYQRVFNDEGLTSICYEPSPILTGGNIQHQPPFSGYELLPIPELKRFHNNGQIEAFITAGASIAPWTFKKMGVGNFMEKTVRWPGFVDFVKNIPREKFIEKISPHINIPVTRKNPDLVWMRVEASGYKKLQFTRENYSMLELFDNKTGLTAMERTTGFTTAIIARMIANGQSNIGVNTPETAFSKNQLKLLWKEVNECFKIRNT